MPEDPNIHPDWAAEAKDIADSLDLLDYFQILGAEIEAPAEELKLRYHQLQRNYHPDTFFSSPDLELRAAVTKIAKRVAEAYVILRDPQKRAKYTRDIAGPERAQRLRYSEDSEREARQEKVEELGRTAQGRKLWAKAQDCLRRGDLQGAQRDLQTALLFERDNERFKTKLDEIKAQLGAR
ncbi:MAG: DnaJ domain-containing protein [Deltaproteobacteria bacterium]|nr:DnaJ domain-containing protein [Deltaproteobacteria bacterium]